MVLSNLNKYLRVAGCRSNARAQKVAEGEPKVMELEFKADFLTDEAGKAVVLPNQMTTRASVLPSTKEKFVAKNVALKMKTRKRDRMTVE